MYKLKQLPDDFIVGEKLKLVLGEEGDFSYYLLWKKGLSTQTAVQRVAKEYKTHPKFINYCGLKDKNAVTTQFISIKNGPEYPVNKKDLKACFLGKGDDRLSIGQLDGNRFIITVRNIDKPPVAVKKILNLFDEQRYGINKNNASIGKLLIKKDFQKAAEMLANNHDKVKEALARYPTNPLKAITSIERLTIRLYLHAYQSRLWDSAAKEFASSGIRELPMVGFDTEWVDDRVKDKYESLLLADGIVIRDFIIPQLQGESLTGTLRPLFAEVKHLRIDQLQIDELNDGKKKVVISFSLPKGAYATQVIKQMFH